MFSNISGSEQTHMDTMLAMLNIYGVADPVVDDTAGSFANITLAGLYVDLVANGEVSLLDALFVGALIEEIDIRDIQQAIDETVHADIITAYENLMAGSKNHLRAFVSQIELLGVEYVAQLEISITTGGVFDSPVPEPASEPGGTVLLHFDSCNSGMVSYEIPSINRTGVIPIERVARDNVALCEMIIGAAD